VESLTRQVNAAGLEQAQKPETFELDPEEVAEDKLYTALCELAEKSGFGLPAKADMDFFSHGEGGARWTDRMLGYELERSYWRPDEEFTLRCFLDHEHIAQRFSLTTAVGDLRRFIDNARYLRAVADEMLQIEAAEEARQREKPLMEPPVFAYTGPFSDTLTIDTTGDWPMLHFHTARGNHKTLELVISRNRFRELFLFLVCAQSQFIYSPGCWLTWSYESRSHVPPSRVPDDYEEPKDVLTLVAHDENGAVYRIEFDHRTGRRLGRDRLNEYILHLSSYMEALVEWSE
jgi:hypothetical protein